MLAAAGGTALAGVIILGSVLTSPDESAGMWTVPGEVPVTGPAASNLVPGAEGTADPSSPSAADAEAAPPSGGIESSTSSDDEPPGTDAAGGPSADSAGGGTGAGDRDERSSARGNDSADDHSRDASSRDASTQDQDQLVDRPGSSDRDNSDGDSRAGLDVDVRAFGSQERVHLPTADSVDWVLFGATEVRADVRSSSIGTARVGSGSVLGGYTNRFFWTGGRPYPTGSDDIDRLVLTAAAVLDVARGSEGRRLDLYVGCSTPEVQLTIGSGQNARSAVVRLPASDPGRDYDGIVSVGLPAGSGFEEVTVSGGGNARVTLAAAVLRR